MQSAPPAPLIVCLPGPPIIRLFALVPLVVPVALAIIWVAMFIAAHSIGLIKFGVIADWLSDEREPGTVLLAVEMDAMPKTATIARRVKPRMSSRLGLIRAEPQA